MRMNTICRLILVAVLALGSGCAKPDWIDQTLMTVDVTGTWRDSGGTIDLILEEQGSKVTGSMVWRGSFTSASGTISGGIDGSVAGEVFRFKQTRGIDIGVNGELTVNEDEMSGVVDGPLAAETYSCDAPIHPLPLVRSSRPKRRSTWLTDTPKLS